MKSFLCLFYIIILSSFYCLKIVAVEDICKEGIMTMSSGNEISVGRSFGAAASSGAMAVFAGGIAEDGGKGIPSDRVDIYNYTANLWKTATLSEARGYLVAVSVGNMILFAGGWNLSSMSTCVDVFRVNTEVWSVFPNGLSLARNYLATFSIKDIVLFAGGNGISSTSSSIDIYNSTSNIFEYSLMELSVARWYLAGASNSEVGIFAGGIRGLSVIDIYNVASCSWTTSTLSIGRAGLSGVSLGTLIFFAGGYDGNASGIYFATVDVYNSSDNVWFTLSLSNGGRRDIRSTSIGCKVLFTGGINLSLNIGYSLIDIYDVYTHSWSTSSLVNAVNRHVAVTIKNDLVIVALGATSIFERPTKTNYFLFCPNGMFFLIKFT